MKADIFPGLFKADTGNITEEIWKFHPDYPYKFSNLGNVISYCNPSKPRVITGSRIRGHHRIEFPLNDGVRGPQTMLHKVIAELFLGPRPAYKHEVCHRNGNRDDNRASNLYWGTRHENSTDRHTHNGTSNGGKRSRLRKRVTTGANAQNALRDRLAFAIQKGTGNETITIPISLAKEIMEILSGHSLS